MNCFRSALIGLVIASSAIVASSAQAAPKKYQVTGIVIDLTEKMVVVQKEDEKFEIARDSEMKVDGKLKVGAKVTVYYYMTATSIEVKEKK